MAGGSWNSQNKKRPGVYIRFRTASTPGVTEGNRGVVAICEPLSWGEVGKVVEVTPQSDIKAITGYDLSDPKNRFLTEIFKGTNRTSGPTKVLLYRPAASGAALATATIGNLTATAKYVGVRGNDITIVIVANTDSTYTVTTIVGGIVEDTQTVANVAGLEDNAWVAFSGTAISATTGTALTNGSDGTVAASAYSTFLTAIEGYKFDILCYDGTDATTKAAMVNFVKRLAEENGQYAQLVVSGASNPDTRFVINSVSDVTLEDGTQLSAAQVTWWLAGAQAGALYNESLTYAVYPGAAAVTTPLSNDQIIAAIEAGDLVLQSDDGVVRIETDINSLVTFTANIGKAYRKNRVIRLCNQIANDIYTQFSNNFIGIIPNNEVGRSRLKAVVVSYLMNIQANGGIQNFASSDVEVLQGEDIDAVVINLAIQPLDAVEKIYMTVEVA